MEVKGINALKEYVRSRVYNNDHYKDVWSKGNPFVGTDKEWAFKGKTDFTIGIIFDPAHYHMYFIAACIDLQVSYKVVDILQDEWIKKVEEANCVGFMIWPHLNSMVLKDILDERIFLIQKYLKIPVYPDPEGVSLLDNKRRVRDWLLANKFEPPKTWCFSDKMEAESFIKNADFPLVFKTVKGSVSRGVEIIRTKARAQHLVNKCFGKGMYPFRMDKRNNQWDFILFQEYLENCYETRIIRIGDSYFGIEKVRGTTAYHSGSGHMKWLDKNEYLLNKTKEITDRGGFRCMNVDFLIDKNGKDYVNELHALFHGPRINNKENQGKYLYDEHLRQWHFVEGNYYRNYTTNERVLDFIKQVGKSIDDDGSWLLKDVFYEINGIRF